MAHRKEQREAARQARLEEERRAKAAAKRKRMLGLGAAGVLGVAAIAAIVVAVVLGSGGGGDGDGPAQAASGGSGGAPIPEQQIAELDAAAEAAGCEVQTDLAEEGREHVNEGPIEYQTNPPTSGNHRAIPAEDGIYDRGNQPETEATVHSLEHGRINLQYSPELTDQQVAQLETLAGERGGYHILLFENDTDMPYAVAASSWTRMIGCEEFNERVFDALRAFRNEYTDQAPEVVP